MSENTPTSGISADYAQRITDDLAANRSEQERARTELTRLQDELLQLEEGERVLVKMQEVLGGTGKPAARKAKAGGKAGKAAASVPAARRAKGRTTAKKSNSGSKPQAGQQPSTDRTTAAKKAGEPTWRELVTGYLADQREPRSAAEVAAALSEAHPQRTTQVTVVRNTLEQGVAHGLLERSKQGRSVYYSPVSAASVGGAGTAAE
ncbi:hypothetical protein C5F59_037645 [Streptomyces sp. QL37]|uniref:hypothetical protein n=1 Tax=Streptomyces sp. QL37 TaxID=2093747 RepID=UPI000CF243BF|nr:hypothetical protein [Streptomyces sp. QL37]PPQ61849.1 hypothetical protein C5F59_38155 [Streptomyces sp. QL37]